MIENKNENETDPHPIVITKDQFLVMLKRYGIGQLPPGYVIEGMEEVQDYLDFSALAYLSHKLEK